MKLYNYLVLIITGMTMSGCHLEQGKLYFDELNFDPIGVYKMAPMETAVYCFAEDNNKTDQELEKMHIGALETVEKNPETGNWGQLVCLALSEQATIKQIKETINTLQLVIAVKHQQSNPARSFKKLLEQKLRLKQDIAQGVKTIELEKEHSARIESNYKKEIEKQKAVTAVQKSRVSELEKKVKKLQEIELLLHPKDKS